MDNFSDLEKDIAGDWLSIQKRIQDDERREKELNSPTRLHCSYKEFYKRIYEYAYNHSNYNREIALHEILRMVLSGNEKLPAGFENIWNVLCDTHRHAINTIECMNCGEKYELLYKRTIPSVSYKFGQGIADAITMRYELIYCPKCGKPVGRLNEGTFISLTTYNNIHGNMEERSNDIK